MTTLLSYKKWSHTEIKCWVKSHPRAILMALVPHISLLTHGKRAWWAHSGIHFNLAEVAKSPKNLLANKTSNPLLINMWMASVSPEEGVPWQLDVDRNSCNLLFKGCHTQGWHSMIDISVSWNPPLCHCDQGMCGSMLLWPHTEATMQELLAACFVN